MTKKLKIKELSLSDEVVTPNGDKAQITSLSVSGAGAIQVKLLDKKGRRSCVVYREDALIELSL